MSNSIKRNIQTTFSLFFFKEISPALRHQWPEHFWFWGMFVNWDTLFFLSFSLSLSHTHTHAHTHTHIHTHTYSRTYAHILLTDRHTYIHKHTFTHKLTCIHTNFYPYFYSHTHKRTFICDAKGVQLNTSEFWEKFQSPMNDRST